MARIAYFADEEDGTDELDDCGVCGAPLGVRHAPDCPCGDDDVDELGIGDDDEEADFDDPDPDEDLQGLNDLRE